ncbi:LysR family transcriptional regulator [Glycomyces endophyticus]|uniref:LysR family transcriptional regulator n=1 Tax=Glycomyces endophyticus TaxID=480996 RepID=A0ABP4TIY8_9ACTN
MDRLLIMKSFVTAAKVGSFSGAAKELGTSGSLISRHVADLEKQLGVQLVTRTARSISLTESGSRYAEFARRILDDIDAEDAGISALHDRPEGPLSVICPKWIGTLDLGDAVAAFAAAHPRIHLRLELGGMSDRTYDFLENGFDVAFHTRDLRDSNVRLKKIATLPFVLCASESYLRRSGPLDAPGDLNDHECLVHLNDPVWRIGHGYRSTLHKIRNTVFQSNSYLAIQKAAVHGRGVALIPQRPAAADLESGALRELLPDLPVPERPLYAVYGPSQNASTRVKLFLDFLTKWFAEQQPAPRASTG